MEYYYINDMTRLYLLTLIPLKLMSNGHGTMTICFWKHCICTKTEWLKAGLSATMLHGLALLQENFTWYIICVWLVFAAAFSLGGHTLLPVGAFFWVQKRGKSRGKRELRLPFVQAWTEKGKIKKLIILFTYQHLRGVIWVFCLIILNTLKEVSNPNGRNDQFDN